MRHRWIPLQSAVLGLMLTGVACAGSLSEVEAKLAEEVDRRQPQALALLEQTVNINSGTMNFAGVREVGELFDKALADIGLTTRWVDGAAFDRAGHLVAEYGTTGPHLLLIGHLDTAFEPDSPFQRFERDGMRARGPGVTDMKGGNVVIVEALAALKAVGVLDELQVTVVLIGDEESSGQPLSLARQALVEAARAADVALGFEDGDGDPATAVIARRGYTSWQLEVSATPAHSSLIFREEVGAGAVFEAARILDAFRSELGGEQYLTFNPGVMLAGTQVDYDADISFTAGYVDMALDGLGLMGTGGHTVEETADLTTLPSQAKRAAILMYRLRE